MPEKKTLERAEEDKSASTRAGEFVCEEVEHIGEGKHGAAFKRKPQALSKQAKRAAAARRKQGSVTGAGKKRRTSGNRK